MPQITLPDGTHRDYDAPVTPAQVAADIGPGLAKAALGARIDGELADLSTVMETDAQLALVTAKNRDGEADEDGLFLIRHSCAHVMAEAIEELFPGTRLVYGPPVDNGFYYDIAFPEGNMISSEDFARIEQVMKRIVKEAVSYTHLTLPTKA